MNFHVFSGEHLSRSCVFRTLTCDHLWNTCDSQVIHMITHDNTCRTWFIFPYGRFSKRIPCLSNLPYSDRLTRLGLESLEIRRLHFDLINYYKVLNDLSPIVSSDHFLIHHPIPSSRSSIPLLQLRCNHAPSSSFFYRQVDAWNYLPCALKVLPSLPSFKAAIKKVNLSSFLKGNAFS